MDERQMLVSFSGYTQLMFWTMFPLLMLLVKAPAIVTFALSLIVGLFTVASVSEWGLKTLHAGYALVVASFLIVLSVLNLSNNEFVPTLTNVLLLLTVLNAFLAITLAQGVKKLFGGTT